MNKNTKYVQVDDRKLDKLGKGYAKVWSLGNTGLRWDVRRFKRPL